MNVTITDTLAAKVVVLDGRLDSATSPDVQGKLEALISGGSSRLVVDCASLVYLSSAGLRVFLAAVKKARAAHGGICLAAVIPEVKNIITMAGFTAFLPAYATVAEAAAASS